MNDGRKKLMVMEHKTRLLLCSHIDVFMHIVYHVFMHTVKSSCYASLTEQSGLLRLQEHFRVQPRVSEWRSNFVVSRTGLRRFELLCI